MGDKHYSSGGGGISFGAKSIASGKNSAVTINAPESRSQQPPTDIAEDAAERTDSPLTIGDILKRLEPGQLWGALVAAATVIGGAFLIGQKFHLVDLTSAASSGSTPSAVASVVPAATLRPIPCSEMPDWPRGRWWEWGHLDTPPTQRNTDNWTQIPQVGSEPVFVSDHSFEGYTDERSDNARNTNYKATLNDNETLRAGGPTVHYSGSDQTGYKTEGSMTAKADGCMIEGTFADSAGNRGTYHLLYRSSSYYVVPPRERY